MSEIVNLRRVKKAKARAEKARAADANRTKHGTPKAMRDLAKAREEKIKENLEAHKIEEK